VHRFLEFFLTMKIMEEEFCKDPNHQGRRCGHNCPATPVAWRHYHGLENLNKYLRWNQGEQYMLILQAAIIIWLHKDGPKICMSLRASIDQCCKNRWCVKKKQKILPWFPIPRGYGFKFQPRVRVWWCKSACMIQIKCKQAVQKETEIKSPRRHVHFSLQNLKW